MKAYVLMGGCIDDRHVIGVFSSEQKAQTEKERLISVNSYYKSCPDDLCVDTFEMDKSIYVASDKPEKPASELINDKKREILNVKKELKSELLSCRETARLNGRLYMLEKELAELVLNNLDNINIA